MGEMPRFQRVHPGHRTYASIQDLWNPGKSWLDWHESCRRDFEGAHHRETTMSLLIWSLFLTVVLLGLYGVTRRFTPLRTVKLVFLPGVLLAILSRSLACGLARAPLKEVNFPWRAGPPVAHGKPKIPVWGGLCLALVPFLSGTLVILALRALLVPTLRCQISLPDNMEPNVRAIFTSLETVLGIARSAGSFNLQELPKGWHLFLFFYLGFSILLYSAPLLEEWKRMAGLILVLTLFWGILDYLGLRAGFLSRGWYIGWAYGQAARDALAFLLTCAVLALLLVASTYWGLRFIQATFGRKKPSHQAA